MSSRLRPVALLRPRAAVFVAMSFRADEDPLLEDSWMAIQRAIKRSRCPVDLRRIDESEGDYEISQRIMEEIARCDFMVADLTNTPHNVYFEIGYGRGVDKPIIQLAREGTPLEFDIRNWRTRFYRNSTELEACLVPAIRKQYREWFQRNDGTS